MLLLFPDELIPKAPVEKLLLPTDPAEKPPNGLIPDMLNIDGVIRDVTRTIVNVKRDSQMGIAVFL